MRPSQTQRKYMTTQTTIFPLELKQENEDGTFEGYGAIFGNVDRDGDVVQRGAFAESLKKRTPALLWQHDQKQPIGRFEIIREDEKGLYVKGRLAMKGEGERVHELLKMGALNGLSIGFVAKRASRNATTGVRTIHEADLMEVSLVTFPANEMARVKNVKSYFKDSTMPHTPRSFETLLRDNGFSRNQAKAITAKGFKAADFDRTDEAEIAELVREMKQRTLALEGKRSGGDAAAAVIAALDLLYGGNLDERGRQDARAEIAQKIKEYIFNSIVDSRSGAERMPVVVNAGDRKRFYIPHLFDNQSTRMIGVKVENYRDKKTPVDFVCSMKYLEWTNSGPKQETVTLNASNSRARINVGGARVVRNWALKAEKRDFQDAMALLSRYARGSEMTLKFRKTDRSDRRAVAFRVQVA